ncbi:MAG: efflux RND transporter periplasmic adaptor subunit [Calditrichaeota bacterium]|nr:efflux RND transporter periplasmic adaptor subunit [Calditrichota bacterium]
MKKVANLTVVLLLVMLVLIVGCNGNKDKQDTPALLPDTSGLVIEIPVAGLKLDAKEFNEILTVTGILEAKFRSLLSSETGGRVISWDAEIGDLLEAGDVILQLDDELARLGLQQAEANLESARISAEKSGLDYQRFQELQKNGDMSRNELESVKLAKAGADAMLIAAEATVGITRRVLKETQIRMPYKGRLSGKMIEVGQSLIPGSPVAEVVQINPIKLKVGVPEESIVQIHPGQRVIVNTVGWQDQEFIGRVTAVGIAADMSSRLFPIEVQIPNRGGALIPGMAASGEIILKSHQNAIFMPRNAVNFNGDKATAYFVRGDRAIQKQIETGASNNGMVMIERGAAPGDTVVIIGQDALKPNQKVHLNMDVD